MPNQSGSVYGLTLLCPILMDEHAVPSHDLQIRELLAQLPTGPDSPFANTSSTHMARLVVMDDVVFVGHPAREEHLASKYLVFETNTDDPPARYYAALAAAIPETLDRIWLHCVGYPGATPATEFVRYMQTCQVETTFYFAAVNDQSVAQTLEALATQRAVAELIANYPGTAPTLAEFAHFLEELDASHGLEPGADAPARRIKTGGHNE